ncbi:MAG: xanthine dehydrogenase family protein subunit M, partial [Pseudomonadota bacterium]
YVRAIRFSAPPDNAVSAFQKLGSRSYLVISIAMVAGSLSVDDRGLVDRVALALGACSPVASRLTRVESSLAGHPLTRALVDRVSHDAVAAAVRPIDDVRASADYRVKAAYQLVRDTVAQMLEHTV